MKDLMLIYAGIGGLTLFALLIGGAGMAEKAVLLLLFGVVAEQIASVIKNLWL